LKIRIRLERRVGNGMTLSADVSVETTLRGASAFAELSEEVEKSAIRCLAAKYSPRTDSVSVEHPVS